MNSMNGFQTSQTAVFLLGYVLHVHIYFLFLTVKSILAGFFFFFASLSVEPDLMVSSVGRGKKEGVQMLQSTLR